MRISPRKGEIVSGAFGSREQIRGQFPRSSRLLEGISKLPSFRGKCPSSLGGE